MYDEPYKLFQVYIEEYRVEDADLFDVNGEILKRIGQLDWIILHSQSIYGALEKQFFEKIYLDNNMVCELEIMAESYYHFAFRLRDILRKYHWRFRGFEAVGVRDVRNHLIVHPEKEKDKAKLFPCFNITFSQDCRGPRIKGYIGKSGSAVDSGLFVNAEDYKNQLCIAINKIIKH